jgi:hypothetical protein
MRHRRPTDASLIGGTGDKLFTLILPRQSE